MTHTLCCVTRFVATFTLQLARALSDWRKSALCAMAIFVAGCAPMGVKEHPATRFAEDAAPTSVAPIATPGAESTSPLAAFREADPEPGPGRTESIWTRFRSDQRLAASHWMVEATARKLADKPDQIVSGVKRAAPYMHFFLTEAEKKSIPPGIAVALPWVESAFNAAARSHAGAVGTWQFIQQTGALYGLRQSLLADERRSLVKATTAAFSHLADLYAEFGDWGLALGAYNCGARCITRALERNRQLRMPLDFFSLKLNAETSAYVPKILAIALLLSRAKDFGIDLPVIEDRPVLAQVALTRDIDTRLAATWAGISPDELRRLNPNADRPFIAARAQPYLVLTIAAAERFEQNAKSHRGPTATWTLRQLSAGESLKDVAYRSATQVDTLRAVNGISNRMKPAAGSTLIVPKHGSDAETVTDDAIHSASLHLISDATPSPKSAQAQKSRRNGARNDGTVRAVHRSLPGETLAKMGRRLNVPAVRLQEWNPRLPAGQNVVLPAGTRVLVVRKPARTKPAFRPAAPARKRG